LKPLADPQGDSGFTLIEVLVATFIMSVLSVMGVSMLTNTLRTRDQVEVVVERVQQIELARAVLKNDFTQITDRRVREEYGELQRFAFQAGVGLEPDLLMSFVRNGHVAPGIDETGPTLQYVEYLYRDEDLIRRTRFRLDASPGMAVRERVVLAGVKDLRVSFNDGAAWVDEWLGFGGEGGDANTPRAIALEFSTDRYGEMRWAFMTPEGY